MTTPKVFLHVGFSKTATTSIQNHVFSVMPGIQCLGKPYGDARQGQCLYDELTHLIFADASSYNQGLVKDGLEKLVDPAGGDILISSEGLTYGRHNDPLLIADRLKQLFPEATVIFTIREQRSWLRSLYLDDSSRNLFHAPGTTIGRWFVAEQKKRNRDAFSIANYDATISHYETLYGAENIRVLPFEELQRDRDGFARTLCNALEFDNFEWMRDRLAALPSDNRRLSRRAYAFGLMNYYLVPELFRRAFRFFNPGLEQFLRGGPPANITIPETCQALLIDRYNAGNRRLDDTYDLSLAKYGYML